MTSLIGRRLGRYELRAELGRGGMARVYSALDTLLQRQVAIKVLAAQLSLDEEFVRRFEREATTAANLRHPAIVTIYDVGEQDDLHYIAMELVSGRSLHAIIEERTTLGLGYAVSLLDPVARALDYAHAQGAVHRDIKPHNILIDHDGRVLITDFGIAQTADSDGDRLTRTGVFMGTPEYISPEQAESQRVDGRSDLYSLAVVAYEIITGRVPFAGGTPQLIVAHAQLPPPPPTSVLAHLPGELDEVLVRALAKRPERRYPTGSDLIAALRMVAERYGTPVATREQLASLADPAGVAPTPPSPLPIPSPRPQAQPSWPAPSSAAQPTHSEPFAAPLPVPGPRAQTLPQRPPISSGPRPQVPPRPLIGRATSAASPLPLLIIGGLLVTVTLALLFAVTQGLANSGRNTPTASVPFTLVTPTLVVPTVEPSPTQSGLVATMFPAVPPTLVLPTAPSEPAVPEVPPTLAPAPPTLVPAPPTSTSAPPTSTSAPPTSTSAPPTSTSAPPTNTSAPPTITQTEDTPLLGSPVVVTPILSLSTVVTPILSSPTVVTPTSRPYP